MRHVLGVDGGNTKTIALVAREDGQVVGKGRAGCADIHAARGPEAAIAELAAAVTAALASAGLAGGELAVAAFSLAGADWPEDFAFLRERLETGLGLVVSQIVNDSLGLLRCGSETMTGVAVGVGTGAAIGARSAAGEVFHLGFWPDPMGGDALAEAGLGAVTRADLGVGPATDLTGRLCARFGVSTARELLHVLTRYDRSSGVAGLSALVLDTADDGDPVAVELVQAQAALLGRAARITADAVSLGDGEPLVLGGGVLAHPSRLLEHGIVAAGGFEVVVRPSVEPVLGALLLAFDAAGLAPPVEDLAASLPEKAYFATT